MRLILIIFVFLIASFIVKSNQYLIEEIESLRNSLAYNDPTKGELTLRLADLYFDASIKEQSGEKVVENRQRALELYSQVLGGDEGIAPATGLLKTKIQFQIGRLWEKLKNFDQAAKLFTDVYESKTTNKKLKREAAFHLAEYYETKANFPKANHFYKLATTLCSSIDSCNYAHYRRGWLLYKETHLDEAIAELKLSLWDGKGQIREKVLNDYILFLSQKTTNGKKELQELEGLAQKINKGKLLRQMSEAFYTAGNRQAGTLFLGHINKRQVSAYFNIRLMEEYYGFRDWPKVDFYLRKIEKLNPDQLPSKSEEAKETKTILRRFIVQLDAEVQENSGRKDALKKTILTYLRFYPQDEMRRKMQEGWLKIEDDSSKKIAQIKKWIDEEQGFSTPLEDIRKLHQTRLALAQKLKNSEVVISESKAMIQLLGDNKETREFSYVLAKEYYDQKKFDLALPIFKTLAENALSEDIADRWSILAQNLALDILNTQKNYSQLIELANNWLENKSITDQQQLKNELMQMAQISKQAKFEHATSLGQSKEALEIFYKYCFDNLFIEKSCANAKILAVKLKDQEKIMALLEHSQDEKSLMSEYELTGQFQKAARLQEKFNLKNNKSPEIYLKVAMLYELDRDFKNRDRILTSLMNKLKKGKKIEPKIERAIYITLKEANLLNTHSLNLPWSLSTKLELADRLETLKSQKITKKLLLSQKDYAGKAWAKLVLSRIQEKDRNQAKISFYGRRSKRLFKRRTKALEDLVKLANIYLEGANQESRVYILNILENAYTQFSEQIVATPLPKDLDEETLGQVKQQLAQMAAPFEKVAKDYQDLKLKQIGSISDESLKSVVTTNIAKNDVNYPELIEPTKISSINIKAFNYENMIVAQHKLKKNPEDEQALIDLMNFYEDNKSSRISSYYKGRLESLRN